MHDELNSEEKEYVQKALAANVGMTEILMVIVCARLANQLPSDREIKTLEMQQTFTKIRTAIQQEFRKTAGIPDDVKEN